MSKRTLSPDQTELRELSADELSSVDGGWGWALGPIGSFMGHVATGGYGNIPDDAAESSMSGWNDDWYDGSSPF